MLFSWSQKEWPDSFHFFFFFFFRMKISSFEHYPVASCKLIIYFFSHPRSSSVAGWAIGCFDAIAHTRAVARNYVAKRILLQFAQKKKKQKRSASLCPDIPAVLWFMRSCLKEGTSMHFCFFGGGNHFKRWGWGWICWQWLHLPVHTGAFNKNPNCRLCGTRPCSRKWSILKGEEVSMNCKSLFGFANPDLKCVVKSAAQCLGTKFALTCVLASRGDSGDSNNQ